MRERGGKGLGRNVVFFLEKKRLGIIEKIIFCGEKPPSSLSFALICDLSPPARPLESAVGSRQRWISSNDGRTILFSQL